MSKKERIFVTLLISLTLIVTLFITWDSITSRYTASIFLSKITAQDFNAAAQYVYFFESSNSQNVTRKQWIESMEQYYANQTYVSDYSNIDIKKDDGAVAAQVDLTLYEDGVSRDVRVEVHFIDNGLFRRVVRINVLADSTPEILESLSTVK